MAGGKTHQHVMCGLHHINISDILKPASPPGQKSESERQQIPKNQHSAFTKFPQNENSVSE